MDIPLKTCLEGSCVGRMCEPESRKCVGNSVLECNEVGTAFLESVQCEDICVAGECVSSNCVPGEKQCSVDILLTCNENGNGYDLVDCTSTQQIRIASLSDAQLIVLGSHTRGTQFTPLLSEQIC